MRWLVRTPVLLLLGLVAPALLMFSGCAGNSLAMQKQVKDLTDQQAAMQKTLAMAQNRANASDRDNLELQTLLAESRKRTIILEDEAAAVREQLATTSAQLAKAMETKAETDKQVKAMTVAMQRRGSVSISPNSSVRVSLPEIRLQGVDVRRDGDVVRIALPADRLFMPNSAQLRPDATTYLSQVAAEVQKKYPRQMIGVEGHTDLRPASMAGYRNAHELSVAWAVAVHNYLATRTGLRPNQLVVTGHGSNFPLYSNASAGGAQRNRRVELVIHPDRAK